jgi:hypothetical protein
MKNGNGAELTSEQRYEMQNQRLNNQIQQKDALKKILTDEQFEKWEKIMNNKRNKQGQKGNRQGNPSKK